MRKKKSMSRELEALKNIKQDYCNGRMCPQSVDACRMCDIGILETALKEKEQQDNLIKLIKETIEFGIKDNKVDVSEEGDVSIVGNIGLILRKELDKKERTLFRNWILETCFPKELKELEVIKEKRVAINILLMSEDASVYNTLYEIVIIPPDSKAHWNYILTQEEFELLKEMLK